MSAALFFSLSPSVKWPHILSRIHIMPDKCLLVRVASPSWSSKDSLSRLAGWLSSSPRFLRWLVHSHCNPEKVDILLAAAFRSHWKCAIGWLFRKYVKASVAFCPIGPSVPTEKSFHRASMTIEIQFWRRGSEGSVFASQYLCDNAACPLQAGNHPENKKKRGA